MMWTIRDVMDRQPSVVGEAATVDETLRQLWRDRTDEVYVTDAAGRLLGTVPDFELLKAMMNGTSVEHGIPCLMSRCPTTITADRPLDQVAALFRDGRCRQIAVVEDGRLVGVLHRRTVLGCLAGLTRAEAEPASVAPPRLRRAPLGRKRPAAEAHAAG